ncbi:MAG: hypothetical protein OXI53_08705 [Nitrospira sp.]|nr:hypothetical protein [Nitrospira sp.]
MTVREDIDQYIAFFRDKTAEIGRLEVLPIYRKILYLVEIDTLSRAAFPSEKSHNHKKRVIQFLNECSNWRDKNRVSAVLLKYSLEKNGKCSGALFDLIKKRIDSWGCGTIIYSDQDLTFEEVQNCATPDVLKFVEENRYVKLFYRYRNFLIHEFREPPEFGMDLGTDSTKPYYLGMVAHQSAEESSWKPVFPVKFLEVLCRNSINGLKRYLIENNQNPYESYPEEFGTTG